jgi:hypothetical protein
MATSYSGFTYNDLKEINITVRRGKIFPSPIATIFTPSAMLLEALEMSNQLPLGTEKAKSEMIVAPILAELWKKNRTAFAFFSGYTFDVDKEQGLAGRCDFLLSSVADSPLIEAPVLAIVEAKNDNVDEAVPQCVAQMYAAQMFNERNGKPLPSIYGATTNGFDWLFMRLEGSLVTVDKDIYQLRALAELLGVLQHIIDVYKVLP